MVFYFMAICLSENSLPNLKVTRQIPGLIGRAYVYKQSELRNVLLSCFDFGFELPSSLLLSGIIYVGQDT